MMAITDDCRTDTEGKRWIKVRATAARFTTREVIENDEKDKHPVVQQRLAYLKADTLGNEKIANKILNALIRIKNFSRKDVRNLKSHLGVVITGAFENKTIQEVIGMKGGPVNTRRGLHIEEYLKEDNSMVLAAWCMKPMPAPLVINSTKP